MIFVRMGNEEMLEIAVVHTVPENLLQTVRAVIDLVPVVDTE
jgi:hypothetical protein